MKSIFSIGLILVLLSIFFLIYFDQLMHPAIIENPILPGIGSFKGPAPAASGTAPAATGTFSPPVFTGPQASPKIIGPKGPPPQ